MKRPFRSIFFAKKSTVAAFKPFVDKRMVLGKGLSKSVIHQLKFNISAGYGHLEVETEIQV